MVKPIRSSISCIAAIKQGELPIATNLRTVVSVATQYRNSAIPLTDLIQQGNTGQMQAVDKRDWLCFSTYAVW